MFTGWNGIVNIFCISVYSGAGLQRCFSENHTELLRGFSNVAYAR
jgi:hypothetical protein